MKKILDKIYKIIESGDCEVKENSEEKYTIKYKSYKIVIWHNERVKGDFAFFKGTFSWEYDIWIYKDDDYKEYECNNHTNSEYQPQIKQILNTLSSYKNPVEESFLKD